MESDSKAPQGTSKNIQEESPAVPVSNDNQNVQSHPSPVSAEGGEEGTVQLPMERRKSASPNRSTESNGGDHGGDGGEEEHIDGSEEGGIMFSDFKAAVDEIDDNIDEALGQAADSIWSFATSVTGRVTSAVKDGQPGLETLRKNVTSRLAPLDTFGRDLTSQIGALTQGEKPLANIAGSVKSVAASVQKNAQAMEAAILARANEVNRNDASEEASGAEGGLTHQDVHPMLAMADSPAEIMPMSERSGNSGEMDINVNEEIAKVGETISNSLVGQTVGGLWSGLWENLAGGEDEDNEDNHAEHLPKTRFEKRLFEIQANPDTYCEPAKDLDAFEEWGKSFVLDDNASSCIAILDTHQAIAELYERVVPTVVDEDTFWMRYFFAKHTLEVEEERRKKLLERAEHAVVEDEVEEDGWGDDDWDENMEVHPDTPKSTQVDSTKASPSSVNKNERSGGTAESERPATASNNELNGDSAGSAKKLTAKENIVAPKDNVENVAAGTETALADDWGDDDWE